MAQRYYIMPKAGTGTYPTDPYRMKYIDNADGTRQIVGIASGMDYGVQPIFLVVADVTPAEHTSISANADVLSVPANLDNNVGAVNVATVRASLEAVNIPAEWVVGGMSWRGLVRWLTRLFAFAQRYNGMFPTASFLDAQTNLDATVGSVPSAARTRYESVAQSFGYDTQQITGSMTIRQVLAAVLATIPDGQLGGALKA